MLIRRPDDVPSSEITPYRVYMNRRHFIGRSAKAAAAAALVPGLLSACDEPQRMEARPAAEPSVGSGGVRMLSQEKDWESVRSEL
ncbi:MAG: twin-arginine translocation signal domain-containing protein, partial [Thermoanaerobaculia bacterium]